VTPKQRRILKALLEAQNRGERLTIDRLISEASLSASKQAAQQTLRSLERRGFLSRRYEKRGERVHLVLEPTLRGLEMVT
jgi:predicted transcriptional regulator